MGGYSNVFPLLVLYVWIASSRSMEVYHTYVPEESYQRMSTIVQQSTGELFVGVTNYIVKLDSNLTVLEKIITGPKNDSVYCPPPSVGKVSLF